MKQGLPGPQCSCSGLHDQNRDDDPRRVCDGMPSVFACKTNSFLTFYFETTTYSEEVGKIVQKSLLYPLCSFSRWLDFT